MSPQHETLVVGIVVGAILGVALSVSRWFVALVSGVAAIAVVFVAIEQGLAGLELYGRALLAEALRHGQLLLGSALGLIAAATFVNSSR